MRLVGRIAARFARRRLHQMRQQASAPEAPQQRVLLRLMDRMAHTRFGREHGLARIRDVGDLARALPLQDYASMAPWWRAAAG